MPITRTRRGTAGRAASAHTSTLAAAFGAAGLLLILAIFGFIHLRRTATEAQIFPAAATPVQASTS